MRVMLRGTLTPKPHLQLTRGAGTPGAAPSPRARPRAEGGARPGLPPAPRGRAALRGPLPPLPAPGGAGARSPGLSVGGAGGACGGRRGGSFQEVAILDPLSRERRASPAMAATDLERFSVSSQRPRSPTRVSWGE